MTYHVHPGLGGHATARRGVPAEQSAREKAAALDGTLLEAGDTRSSRVGRVVLDWMNWVPKRSRFALAGPLRGERPPRPGEAE